LDDLIRVGNTNDGGYILSKRQIEKTDILLSFGVNDDWTFEEDFSKNKKVKVYSYDYSTTKLNFYNPDFGINYACIIFNLLRLKRSMVLHHISYIRNQKSLHKRFVDFFDERKGHYFVPKFIAEYDDDINVSFAAIFDMLGNIEDLSVFLKMDIENSEYLCLPQCIPFLDKINGMVIEFHILAIADTKFEALLDKLSTKFYIAHIHGNNHSKTIYKTNIPEVLEITLINKKLVSKDIVLSKKDYPLKNLDAPCNKNKEDYKLTFSN
jgi:hypothetical protein